MKISSFLKGKKQFVIFVTLVTLVAYVTRKCYYKCGYQVRWFYE